MTPATLSGDDLRAAVSAGIVSESQAARLLTLSQSRAGSRARMTGEDEPFELFKGFSEIFISTGLIILIAGIAGLVAFTGEVLAVNAAGAVLSVALALYFTRRRRMVLPSIVLTTAFWLSTGTAALMLILGELDRIPTSGQVMGTGALVIAALAAWYWLFRVPFTMFVIGASALTTILFSISALTPLAVWSDWTLMFDLGAGSRLALGTLGFGIVVFIAGMVFDMKDPHRIGRFSASGFWLHLLAAPALVNTVALTFVNRGDATGYVLLGVALVVITFLALIIDRRSFLTAGIGYLGVLLALVLTPEGESGPANWAFLLIVLGGFITLTGAFWTAWRSAILRALPDFPGKSRLPPYAS